MYISKEAHRPFSHPTLDLVNPFVLVNPYPAGTGSDKPGCILVALANPFRFIHVEADHMTVQTNMAACKNGWYRLVNLGSSRVKV